MTSRLTAPLLCLLLSLTAVARAGDEPEMAITVNGFGTLGAVYNSNDEYGFVRNTSQYTRPGQQFSLLTQSLLGIQATHSFGAQWQIVGQVVLRDQVEQTLNNTITRAFVSFRPSANLHLRLGRMADATFLMSDYSDVGYAMPWVRPPLESYSVIAPVWYDGLDVTYSLPDDKGVWRLKGLLGRYRAPVPLSDDSRYILAADDMRGLALIREEGSLKLRIGYSVSHMKNGLDAVAPYLPAIGRVTGNPLLKAYYPAIVAEAGALRDGLDSLKGARVGLASAGFVYDDGKWMLQAEASELRADTPLLPVGRQAYASLGYYAGPFLPYVMLSGSRARDHFRAGQDWGQVLGPEAAALQVMGVRALNSARSAQSTLSLGVRWDFRSNAALKLQWDHIHVREAGWALWNQPASGNGKAGQANLWSLNLDFVF